MKNKTILKFILAIAFTFACGATAWAQTIVPSTFKSITIDGSFGDWTGVPLAYTAVDGSTNAIQYENIYIANDQTNLYIRFTLYAPRPDALANSYDNIFIDTDNNPATGLAVGGVGSEMLIQGGAGYQETNGGFNVGDVNNLGWDIAGSADSLDFEFSISLGATFVSSDLPVFTNSTIAILLEGDAAGTYVSTEFVPPSGGLVYTFASAPTPLSNNLTLVTLTNSSWNVNASGTDLGTNWLAENFDDTTNGWSSGDGLFGYTPSPGSYPPIDTALPSGPNTYYFRTYFEWTNDISDTAFVVTNYLSDGAVYYLNGTEVARIRMPAGDVSYSTLATGTNSPLGSPDVFGIDGGDLQYGTNVLEVETHQAAGSGADMVFGLSLTAASQFPPLIVDASLPADQTVLAGQPATFTSDILGSGPLTYQWYFDGTNAIAGANASSYTIPLVLTNNAGTYSLSASNQFTNVTTRAALLTVSNTPVIITAQPIDVVAVEGQSAALSVTVSGTPVINYQWFFGANPIPGATNSTYTISSTFPTNSGNYYVVVSNPASSTNSSVANLTVLPDNIPPNIISISAGPSQIVVTFSEPVDPTTANNSANYSVSGGVTVLTATQSTNNSAQVVLTTGGGMNFGTVYSLTVSGVNDLYGNAAHVTGQFTRDITIDGSFDDWTGIAPVYVSGGATGNTNAADFEAIYVYNDANYYYFRVALWTDVTDPPSDHFPSYVNMYFDTDNNPATGFQTFNGIGSEMLVQSGFGYQEKDGSFNDGYSINGLGWSCLPADPGTNFEFQISRAATFGQDGTPVFTTNLINFIFLGQTPQYVAENFAPPIGDGLISYTNVASPSVAPLPLGNLGVNPLSGGQLAIVWNPPGTLQSSTNLTGSWTTVPGATSPYVIPTTGPAQFFRLSQ